MSSSTETASRLDRAFHARFGGDPLICRAPGRVNLIGEHTDYNDGFVMPAAIEFYTYVAASPRSDKKIVVASEGFHDTAEFDVEQLRPGATGHWSDYVRGVAAQLYKRGAATGANLLIHGEVPLGAGLSSSAAIEVATAFALLGISQTKMDRVEIARLCQTAEHQYAGTLCGIMDQFISCFGQQGHALLLDCRSMKHEALSLPRGVRVAICNSKVKHELANGEYNARRRECAEGVAHLSKHVKGVKALRDVSLAQLEEFGKDLPKVTYRRCRHVITEIARTIDAATALKSGDMKRFGKLMGASHASLRDDYEVSCKELDLLVELAMKQPGVLGSRMTGGGFGGCTVSFVKESDVAGFQKAVAEQYSKETGLKPDIFVTAAAEGAGPISTGTAKAGQ